MSWLNSRRFRWAAAFFALSVSQLNFAVLPVIADEQTQSLWGYVDKTGKMFIQPQYEVAGPFAEGLAQVQKKVDDHYRYGYIDPEGKTAIEFDFLEAGGFSEGLAAVRIPDNGPLLDKFGKEASRKWGFIDKTGNFVIEPKFESARAFSEGLASVAQDSKYGFVDKEGNWVIKPKFDIACSFVNDRAAVMTSDGLGFLSIHCNSDIYSASGGKWSYINKKGDVEFGTFEACGVFNDGLSPVALGPNQSKITPDKWGFVNKDGKFVIKPHFNNVHAITEGKAAVQTGVWKTMGNGIKSWIPGKWGYINSKGKQIIESKFDAADPFSDDMAAVRIDNKWGYIDTTGNIVIQPQFIGNWGFKNNLAPVQVNIEIKPEEETEMAPN